MRLVRDGQEPSNNMTHDRRKVVETAKEAAIESEPFGCDKIQGYYFRAHHGERGCPPANVHSPDMAATAQRLQAGFSAGRER